MPIKVVLLIHLFYKAIKSEHGKFGLAAFKSNNNNTKDTQLRYQHKDCLLLQNSLNKGIKCNHSLQIFIKSLSSLDEKHMDSPRSDTNKQY